MSLFGEPKPSGGDPMEPSGQEKGDEEKEVPPIPKEDEAARFQRMGEEVNDAIKKGDAMQAARLHVQHCLDTALAIQKRYELRQECGKDVHEIAESARVSLENALNNRAEELGVSLRFSLPLPKIPKNLLPEHLTIIKKLFQGKCEPMSLPTSKALHLLDKEYQDLMYPVSSSAKDTLRGLISLRSSVFDHLACMAVGIKSNKPLSQLLFYAMAEELQTLGNSLVLFETTLKPNRVDYCKQHYGTIEGTDPAQDPLLPYFQEVFGKDTNRFGHSRDDLQTRLLSRIKEEIEKRSRDYGLSIPEFEVILTPAVAFNLYATFFRPELSQTNTFEWSSTVFRDDKDNGREYQLCVGSSMLGGAADVDFSPPNQRVGSRGARLAIVFKEKVA